MKFLFLLFTFFLVLLSFSVVKATNEGAFSKLYFLTIPVCEDYDIETTCLAYGCEWYGGSCHTPLLTNTTFTVCHEILKIGDYKLCLTTDNKLVLVTNPVGALGLVFIPSRKRREDDILPYPKG